MAILHTRVMIEHDIHDILHGLGIMERRKYMRIAWLLDNRGSNDNF